MRSALAVALAAVLLAPAAAGAQSSPFQALPAPQQTEPQAPAQGATPGGGGISGTQQALLIFAGVALVLAIGVAIARDARQHAPSDGRPGSPARTPDAPGEPGERKKRDSRAADRQKAAAKRARQARKKNRPLRR